MDEPADAGEPGGQEESGEQGEPGETAEPEASGEPGGSSGGGLWDRTLDLDFTINPDGSVTENNAGSKNSPYTVNGNNGIIDPVESALGVSKSAPIDMLQAMAGTNPNYYSAREFQINCQRCVPTFELQRRGYNVEALPNPGR
jgi:hypothetical protein